MDRVAKRLADRAHSLRGVLTDTPFADWEEATERQREFWREIARASQDHGVSDWMGEPAVDPKDLVHTLTGVPMVAMRPHKLKK